MARKQANMAETKRKWLKTDKHGRKNWQSVEEKAMFYFCTIKLSNFFSFNRKVCV